MQTRLLAGPSCLMLLLATLVTSSCTDLVDPSTPEDVARIYPVAGLGQVGVIGNTLAEPVRVRAFDANGETVAGVQINFRIFRGDGHLMDPYDSVAVRETFQITDENGVGEAAWILGRSIGEDSLEAFVPGSAAPAVRIGATVLPVILDLGTLPGHTQGIARAVNESGQIIGDSNGVPFSWTREGGMRELTALAGGSAFAVDLNEAGQIAGSATDETGVWRAVLWENAAAAPVVLQVPGYSSGAMSVNRSGEVLVSACPDSLCTEPEYYVWTSTSATKIEFCTDFVPTDRNDLGRIAGVAKGGCTGTSPERVIVDANGVTVLRGGPLDLSPYSRHGWPTDMNNRGEAIANFRETIFRGMYRTWSGYWSTTGELHELPERFGANKINDLAEVAGSSLGGNSRPSAALWRNGRVYILGSLMDPSGGVSTALDLNNAGVVVGSSLVGGETSESRAIAWLVGPPRPQ